MKKILIGGAGGAPSEGVINSLKRWPRREKILGMGSSKIDLTLSKADRKYLIDNADSSNYLNELIDLLKRIKPNLLHLQNDLEIFTVSKIRDLILDTGIKYFFHKILSGTKNKFKFLRFFSG